MTKKRRRQMLFAAGSTTVLVGVGMAVLLSFGRASSRSALPSPNGYDDLLKAGRAVVTKTNRLADLDQDGLRTLVASNAEALRLLRLGLTRRCAVPTAAQIANFETTSGDLSRLKSLALLLSAEGRLAEMENRPADAAHSYIDAIRLGTEMSRGGFIINRVVGMACEGVGGTALAKLLPRLTCEQVRPLIAELEEIDRSTVTWREVLRDENSFARAQLGKFPNPIKLVSDLWEARGMRNASEERHNLAAAHLRLIAAELALRCYRCDQAVAPSNFLQLVPKYVRRLPMDPFADKPLVYRSDGTNWLLYSIGPDRIDDGGKSLGKTDDYLFLRATDGRKTEKKGDLLYNSPW